jgi:hypothetical protein
VAEPLVVDLRGGLTPQVLDALRQADRVVLASKSVYTAVLGYWVSDELTIGLISSAVARVMLLPHRVDVPIAGPIASLQRRERVHGVVLDTRNAKDAEFLSRMLGVVRVGDTLRLTHDAEAPSHVALQITSHGARVASLRLPRMIRRRRAEDQSAA